MVLLRPNSTSFSFLWACRLLLTLQVSAGMGSEGDLTPSIIRGPRQRQHRSKLKNTYVWPRATLHQCVPAEGKGQKAVTGQEAAPKKR